MALPSVNLSVKPIVTQFFDEASNTISWVVRDPQSRACAVIDAVMEFDQAAGRLTWPVNNL